MTKKTETKELTPEQQAQDALLARQVQIAEEALRPKLELTIAKKVALNEAQDAYTKANAEYEKDYTEIVALQEEIAAIG